MPCRCRQRWNAERVSSGSSPGGHRGNRPAARTYGAGRPTIIASSASVRTRDRGSDGGRGRAAPVMNFAYGASVHSFERIAPSNRGTKHLVALPAKATRHIAQRRDSRMMTAGDTGSRQCCFSLDPQKCPSHPRAVEHLLRHPTPPRSFSERAAAKTQKRSQRYGTSQPTDKRQNRMRVPMTKKTAPLSSPFASAMLAVSPNTRS